MNYKSVAHITKKGFPTSSKFKALEKVIQKRIPVGELAGTHTKEGKIRISKRTPKKYRAEIEEHERREHLYMIKE